MLTEIWESDPFTEKRQSILETLESDYRWNQGDIIVFARGGARDRFRVLNVLVEFNDDGLKREVLALRLE